MFKNLTILNFVKTYMKDKESIYVCVSFNTINFTKVQIKISVKLIIFRDCNKISKILRMMIDVSFSSPIRIYV